ncbi:MAG: aspartate 1-decarboxylase, partial [Halobacteriota archaeon]
ARVTGADLDYEGSVSVGPELLEAADVREFERLQIVNVSNGERLETYAIEGDEGEVCLNGAAARLAEVGDVVILISYGVYGEDDVHEPVVVHVDGSNSIISVE